MAEIERKAQKVFGGNLSPAGNIAVYGSKLAGTVAYSKNLDVIQNNSWLVGLLGSVSPSKAPYLQDLNAIFYVITTQLAYIFQAGVPEWNSETEYFAGKSIVRYNGVIYIAIANNTNKTPTDTSYWARLDNDEFNQTYVNLTNGYPLGKVLRYGRYKIRSLIDNNKNAPTNANIKISDSETGTFYWELIDDIAPGTIMPFAGTKIPNGWILCNGSGKNTDTYPFLFRMIGYTYGGSGETFNVPDFRNKTFWGGDTSNAGTEKTAGLPNIKGTLYSVYSSRRPNEGGESTTGSFGVYSSQNANRDGGGSASDCEFGINFDASRSSSVYKDDETTVQPPAIQTPFIIKY